MATPADVTIDAVTDLAAKAVSGGGPLPERQSELLHRRVRAAVEMGFSQWESFLDMVNKKDQLSANSPARLSAGLLGITKRGMAQPKRKKR